MSEFESRLTRASAPAESHSTPSESKADTACDSLLDTVKSTFDPFKETFSSEGGTLHHVSEAVNSLASLQGMPSQLLNTGIAQIPLLDKMPGMPAATIGVPHLGTPHAHSHPPSSGFPLPSVGATIGSGCLSVLIGGIPAARVLDIGIAPTCGGITPFFDIQTGSSNTFIGGMRAARMGIDMTRHCNPMGHVGHSGGEAASAAEKGEEVASEAAQVSGRAKLLGRAGKAWSVGNAAVGPASGVATAADDASQGEVAAAAMMAAQTAADLAFMALSNLMGKDPGIEPSMGTLLAGDPTVLIGGFPLPDSQMMWHGAKHGIGKKVRPKLPKWAQELACEFKGEPISAVTGEVKNDFTDYETDETLPFIWGRHYCSGWNERNGAQGYGFRHAWQRELQLLRTRAIYTDPRGTKYTFSRNADGTYDGCCQGYSLEQIDSRRFFIRHEAAGDAEFERDAETALSVRCISHQRDRTQSLLRWRPDGHIGKIVQTDHDGNVRRTVSLRYDQSGRIVEVVLTDVDGRDTRIARYAYDTENCLTSYRNALDAISTYEYDAQRRMARLAGANGYSFLYCYDSEGRCVESAGQDRMWHVRFQYRPGRTIVTEGDGGRWTILYNEMGTITHVVDPYGGIAEYVLDPSGRIVEEIDSGGRTLRWLYDARAGTIGRLDRFGNLWPNKDELPNLPNPLAHHVPNAMRGLIWGEFNVDNLTDTVLLPQEIDHWAWGSATDAVARWPDERRQQRDVAGRVIARTNISGHTERFEYDADDNLLLRFDQDGAATRYTRCSWNLLASEENALGETIRYRYTSRRDVASVIDANGNESAYSYDFKKRMTSVTRHGRLRESYVYDGGDRLIEKRDGAGKWLLRFEIGENGLPRERTLASGSKHVYEYDRFGHLTKASTDAHEITRTFDNLGRRTSDKCDGLGVQHEYDGHRLGRTTYLERFEVVYTYTASGQSIRTPGGRTHCVQQGKDGRVLLRLANGTQACYMFDDVGRCTGRITWRTDSPAAFHRVTYEYSGAGELRRISDNQKGDTQYQYDRAHRLIGEMSSGWQACRYEYDPAGNLLALPTCPMMQYTGGNRLSTTSRGQYTYDERNHLSEEIAHDGRRTTYRYDSMDLLVRVEWSDRHDAWTAEYDGLCRQVIAGTDNDSTVYYWDEDRLAAQVDPGGKVRVFVYVDEKSLVPFMFIDYPSIDSPATSGSEYFVLFNQVGMPERIEDVSGRAVWLARKIHSYGVIEVAEGNSLEYDVRWPGHLFQRETGLHVNRFRSYNPMLGRYLQSDPVGHAGGGNLYTYSANPVVEVDVLGLNAHVHGEDASEPSPEGPAVAGRTQELTKAELNHLAKIERRTAERDAAIERMKREIENLEQEKKKLSLDEKNWYSYPETPETKRLDAIRERVLELNDKIKNYPLVRDKTTEFPKGYLQSTHIEMIKRYTREGREGKLPIDPDKNPAGLVAMRSKLTWVDADNHPIPYYTTNDKGEQVVNVTYDHQVSEAEMYNRGATIGGKHYPPGCDSNPENRKKFHNDTDNLAVMSQSENASKGSSSSETNGNERFSYDIPTGDHYS